MWKRLLPFWEALSPHIPRLLTTLIETGNGRGSGNALSTLMRPDLSSVHQGFDELQSDNRELGMQVQDQMVHIKRIEEQLTRVRESNERISTEHLAMVEDLRSMAGMVKRLFSVTLVLLVVLAVLMGWVLVRLAR
jgi:hypothetical protein